MKYLKYSKYIIYLLVLVFTIFLCFRNQDLKNQLTKTKSQIQSFEDLHIQKPETIYKYQPYQINRGYDKSLDPYRLIITTSGSSKALKETFQIPPISQRVVKNNIVGQQSRRDSIVSLTLEDSKVNISSQINDSVYHDRLFKIDLDSYKYVYSNGMLTYQKKPLYTRLKPYTELKVRPYNQLYDLSGGLSFETGKFNYKLSLNLFYYPKLYPGIGRDVELSITYNF